MKRNTLAKILGIGMVAVSTVFLPGMVKGSGWLDIENGSSTENVGGNVVHLINTNSPNRGYSYSDPFNDNGFDIYFQDALSNKSSFVSIDLSKPATFVLPLTYHGNVQSNANNFVDFYFYNTDISDYDYFPSNTLISAKVITKNYTNSVDVKKIVAENGTIAYLNLSNSNGGTNTQVYGTNTVRFVPLNEQTKGKITNITRTSVANTSTYNITAELPIGTSNTLYRSSTPNPGASNFTNGTLVTRFYTPVTDKNFDRGTEITNLVETVSDNVSNTFWSIKESPAFQ